MGFRTTGVIPALQELTFRDNLAYHAQPLVKPVPAPLFVRLARPDMDSKAANVPLVPLERI